MAMTCRYYGISRQLFYTWQRRFDADGPGRAEGSLEAAEDQPAGGPRRGGWQDHLPAAALSLRGSVPQTGPDCAGCLPACQLPHRFRVSPLSGCLPARGAMASTISPQSPTVSAAVSSGPQRCDEPRTVLPPGSRLADERELGTRRRAVSPTGGGRDDRPTGRARHDWRCRTCGAS